MILQSDLERVELIECRMVKVDRLSDNVLARDIADTIYDMTVIRTGMISTRCLDKYGFRDRNITTSDDHFIPRQQAGQRIIDHHRKTRGQYGFMQLFDLVAEFRKVHRVTSDENHRRLRPIQKKYPDLDWQQHYQLADVQLVEDKGLAPWWYTDRVSIEGRIHENTYEAAVDMGCDLEEVIGRIKSRRKAFVNWKRITL